MRLNQRGITGLTCGLTALAASVALLAELPRAAGQQAERLVDAQGDSLPSGAIARLGTTRFRTGSRIFSTAYSPDGKTLAAGCGDDPVHLWDAETGKELRQLKEP